MSINQKGQGLLETIVAIGVITVGLVGVFTLVIGNSNRQRENRDRLVGINLAREGVEVVRNLRDSNWLAGENAFGNILENSIDVVKIPVFPSGATDHWMLASRTIGEGSNTRVYLANIGTDGTRAYIQGNNLRTDEMLSTQFEREISLVPIRCGDAKLQVPCTSIKTDGNGVVPADTTIGVSVTSTVWWQNRARQVSLIDMLYDWR